MSGPHEKEGRPKSMKEERWDRVESGQMVDTEYNFTIVNLEARAISLVTCDFSCML